MLRTKWTAISQYKSLSNSDQRFRAPTSDKRVLLRCVNKLQALDNGTATEKKIATSACKVLYFCNMRIHSSELLYYR